MASPSSRSLPEWTNLISSNKSPALPEAAWLPFGSLLLCQLPPPATRPKVFAVSQYSCWGLNKARQDPCLWSGHGWGGEMDGERVDTVL